jgi:hypothetical protein
MISFKKYTDIVGGIAKKLKVSKDVAVNALIKAQEKGMNPLKWQQNITMLQSYIQIAAEYEPVDEREMSTSQKVTQMNYYWKDLDHMASDERKKKNMQTRFGIKNIKLDKKGNILSFESVEEDRDYKDEYKKFQSSDKMKKYRAELNRYNRKKGTYGNGDGKDASHKDGKIVGMEDQSVNRGRAEKSRLVGSKRK